MDTLTKYNIYRDFGTADYKTTLEPGDDAASQIMGEGWRIPTQSEFQELIDNTNKEWTQVNGVNGYKFTASNDNSIFIPAAGEGQDGSVDGVGNYGNVWSSSLYDPYPSGAWCLDFNSGSCSMFYRSRSKGLPVRGVFK